jgi:hypothetical protein
MTLINWYILVYVLILGKVKEIVMSESVERAVIERRLKFLEEQARLNKDFREYVMKRLSLPPTYEPATNAPQNPSAGAAAYIDEKST